MKKTGFIKPLAAAVLAAGLMIAPAGSLAADNMLITAQAHGRGHGVAGCGYGAGAEGRHGCGERLREYAGCDDPYCPYHGESHHSYYYCGNCGSCRI